MPAQHRHAGPFMNYSHFSQFMNLSIGAAVAMLLDRPAELFAYYRTPREVWAAVRQPRHAAVWGWVALCVAGPVLVMLSGSRMGSTSTVVAAAVTAGLLAWRARSSPLVARTGGTGGAWAYVLVGLAGLVFVTLLAVGFDPLVARVRSAAAPHADGGRLTMLRDLLGVYRQFPLAGTGLGTHEFAFGLFDTRRLPSMATHAENEYAQLMEATGAAGVLLAAAFAAVVAVAYARATRRPAEPVDFVPFGLGFGLVAVLVHSATDFGQHVPADASTSSRSGSGSAWSPSWSTARPTSGSTCRPTQR